MQFSRSLLFLSSLVPSLVAAQTPHGEDESQDMGPVAFMWPPDREWGRAHDNIAPCGSSDGVKDRTDFPLLNGAIALVIQDDSWDVQVSVSYKDDPQSNSDFEVLINPKRIDDIDPGHMCYSLPDPPRDIEDGMNATVQIKYRSEFDEDEMQTFYACTDLTYVAPSKFTTQIPCFNVTSEEFAEKDDDKPKPKSTSDSKPKTTSESSSDSDSSSSDSGSGGLGGGAIAGIVVGSVAGAALIFLAGFVYRRSVQKKRIRLHELSVRNVKWDNVGNRMSDSTTAA
ncbi:hypothetical protein AJ80_02284 [Polytolypa hystricis UAMH7299]|uniref:Copper acquisition factor BIM1-like domain-containing protein n=1 Tax=Polytolypa hystricis (strain UAMH7299) TaxID=1447883 RepID=A0A2B7YS16_POLH7|nr:hypothetical protein AJ80_02284 [Polytolypa hystricis UAMH7299]